MNTVTEYGPALVSLFLAVVIMLVLLGIFIAIPCIVAGLIVKWFQKVTKCN